MHSRITKAFTLIELLIVVAIIAILAAIAVPNFLEAQVRSKVGRAKNDMRSISVGLESYRTDHNMYPADEVAYANNDLGEAPFRGLPQPNPQLRPLSTPIAYMTSIPMDIFGVKASIWNRTGAPTQYRYVSFKRWLQVKSFFTPAPLKADWALKTNGPDQKDSDGSQLAFGMEWICSLGQTPPPKDQELFNSTWVALYDATNGTMSIGDIVRVGP